MRFPSPELLLREARRVLLRFPFVMAAAALAGAAAIVLISKPEMALPLRVLFAAQIGIPFLLALSLYAERTPGVKLPLLIMGTAALAIYAWAMTVPMLRGTEIRIFQYNAAVHLLVAFLPFLRRDEPAAFWQYNKSLFLRILNSLLFTGVLVIGLNVAMLALDKLFGIEIGGETYGRVDLLLLFLFNTWYFLGGVPDDYEELARSRDYPRGLKIFAQYILAPLVAVYLALLTAYLVKVLVTAEWPRGWIGWLVSSVAAAGLFSLALLRPLVENREERWISTYSRVYFVLMLPAIGMLFAALGKRVGQYGFTEPRYFLLVLALWLLAVSVLGALNRLSRLQPLPASLCVIALLCSFGPWGAYSVSQSSQTGRLEALLLDAGALADGKLISPPAAVDGDSRREISAIVDYLVESHGQDALLRWLNSEQKAELSAAADTLVSRHERPELSRRFLGFASLEYEPAWRHHAENGWHFVERPEGEQAIDLAGFDRMQPLRLRQDGYCEFRLGKQLLRARLEGGSVALSDESGALFAIPLAAALDAMAGEGAGRPGGRAPGEAMQVGAEGSGLRVRLFIDSVRWQEQEGAPGVTELTGSLLIAEH